MALYDVLPCTTVNDLIDRDEMDTEGDRYGFLCLSGTNTGTDFADLILGEFRQPRMRASEVAPSGSPLSDHVLSVVGISAEKQMVRPHTRRVIALVTDQHPCRNLTKVHFPRKTMGKHDPGSVSSLDLPVAERNMCTRPDPARVGFGDLLPETGLDRSASDFQRNGNRHASPPASPVAGTETPRQHWAFTVGLATENGEAIFSWHAQHHTEWGE